MSQSVERHLHNEYSARHPQDIRHPEFPNGDSSVYWRRLLANCATPLPGHPEHERARLATARWLQARVDFLERTTDGDPPAMSDLG